MKDYIIRGIDKNKSMRFFIATTSNTVEKARKVHNTSPTATAALGRMLTGAAIMGVAMKNEDDSLTFSVRGDGLAGNIVTVANNKGEVKGYLDHPERDIKSRPDGKLDVGGFVGHSGYMTVIRDLGLKEPYTGQAELVSGEIAEDLVNYYYISEQQPSAINLGVLVDKDISVRAAGGYMIQLLPNVREEDIVKLENALKKAKPISTLIDGGLSPEDILDEVFGDLNMEILDKKEISFVCDCSRERVERLILSLGREEIESLTEDEDTEIVCHFCNKKYNFTGEELKEFLV